MFYRRKKLNPTLPLFLNNEISIVATTKLLTVDMDTILNRYRKSGNVRSLGKKSAFLCASRLEKLFKVSGVSTRYVYIRIKAKFPND